MRHFLVVVDMQKDFEDGALGSKEAQAMIPAAAAIQAREDMEQSFVLSIQKGSCMKKSFLRDMTKQRITAWS